MRRPNMTKIGLRAKRAYLGALERAIILKNNSASLLPHIKLENV